MRCFIAIPINEEIAINLEKVQKDLKPIGNLKLVPRENMHITLKFLGEIPEPKVEKVKKSLNSLESYGKFEVSLAGIGSFPNESYVRVIWAAVHKGFNDIMELQRRVDNNLVKLNFDKEARFHPHATIARVKSINSKEKLKKIFEKYKKVEFGSFLAEKFCLMESKLSKEGAKYFTLREFYL